MSQSIAKKLLAVSKAVGHIEKNGLNSHFKFKYQAWDDVVPAVRNACAEVGLALLPSCDLIEKNGNHVSVRISVKLIDSETGEMLESTTVGEAQGNDDKGFQKAYTSGYKYLLLKTFMIPMAGDEDPDGHGPAQASPAEPSRVPNGNGNNLDAAKRKLADILGLQMAGLKEFWAPYAAAKVSLIGAVEYLERERLEGAEALGYLEWLLPKATTNVG